MYSGTPLKAPDLGTYFQIIGIRLFVYDYDYGCLNAIFNNFSVIYHGNQLYFWMNPKYPNSRIRFSLRTKRDRRGRDRMVIHGFITTCVLSVLTNKTDSHDIIEILVKMA